MPIPLLSDSLIFIFKHTYHGLSMVICVPDTVFYLVGFELLCLLIPFLFYVTDPIIST